MKNILNKIVKILKSKKFLVILSLLVIIIFIVLVKDSLAADALKFKDLTPEQQKEVMNQLTSSANPFSAITNTISEFFTSTLLKLPIALASIIADVGGFIINAEGKLLSWVVDIASFTNLGVVQQGWKICRDFSNLFFIAILIYIAFATILRIQKVDAKKMLFKVITMAIIINFSLMIGGMIIDFSQVMFKYFIFAPLQVQDKDGFHFSEILMDAVGVQNIRNTSVPLEATSVLIRLIFVILFTFLCVIVFGALVFTLLIRNFWLWILLILAPLAWFLGIVPIPILSKYASEWWRNFLKWCFMAPIMGFFIFLSVGILGSNTSNVSMEQLTKPIDKMEGYYDGKIDKSVISFSEEESSIFHPKMIIKFLIIISFLIAGLMAGQSLGSGAAKGALGMLNKAKSGTQKWMGKRVANNPLTRGATGLGAKGLNALSTVPVLGRAFKGMAVGVNKKKEELRKEKGKLGKDFTPEQANALWNSGNLNMFEKKEVAEKIGYDNLSKERFTEVWKNSNDSEKVKITKKIGHDKLSEEQFGNMQSIYSRTGMDKEKKDMEKAAPQFTPEFKKEAKEAVNTKKEFEQKSEQNNKRYENESNAIDTDIETASQKHEFAKKVDEEAGKNLERNKGAGYRPGLPQAKEEKDKTESSLKTTDDILAKLKERKNKLNADRDADREKAENEFNKAMAPMMERFNGVDMSKLKDLGGLLNEKDSDNHPTARADVMTHILSQKHDEEISKAISNIVVKGGDGKKDITGTFALRKEIGVNLAENLYLHGGAELSEKMDAVLKMRKVDSSPSALAGGYSLKDIVGGMTTINSGMKKTILLRAKDKKASDEKLSILAEEVRKIDNTSDSTKGVKGGKGEATIEPEQPEKTPV